jgi:hypothetical protein
LARQRKPPKSLHALVRDAFNTPVGKPALDELIRVYVHKDAFSKDPYQTAFLAGQRSLVLTLAHYTNGQQLEIEDDGGNADLDTDPI